MAQTVTPSQTKFGYECFYRCDQCYKNVYENYQWLNLVKLADKDVQDDSKCPYCDAEIDFDLSAIDKPSNSVPPILRFPGKDYSFVFKTDQSVLTTVTVTVKGTLGKSFEINWGDKNKTITALTGANQDITHDYTTTESYYILISCEKNILTYFRIHSSKLTSHLPTPNTQTNLTEFYLQINNFTGSIPPLSGMTKLVNLYLSNNNLTGTIPSLDGLSKAGYLTFNNNSLSGNFPSLLALSTLSRLAFQYNQISGSIPSLVNNTNLIFIICHYNNLSGSIPSLNNNTKLDQLRCNNNAITGSIPSLTNNIKLIRLYVWSNQITGYTASTLSLTLTDFRAQNNQLPSAAINQILADFTTNLASRPGTGVIALHGTGNQPPTGQGIIDKASIIAHGWTVLTN